MEEIKIKYLIEAQDKATKEIEKIDKSIGNLKKNMSDTDKIMKENEQTQKGLISTYQKIASSIDSTVSVFTKLYQAIDNFNFKKLERILKVLAFIAKLKGYDGLSKSISGVAQKVGYLGDQFEELKEKVKGVNEEYGSLMAAFLELSGINAVISGFKKVGTTALALGTSFLALSASITVVTGLKHSIIALKGPILALESTIIKTFGESFPRATAIAVKGIDLLWQGMNKALRAIRLTNVSLKGSMKITKSVGGSFMKAAAHTEVLEKGLFGIVTRVSLLSGAFTALGRILIDSDSILTKMAGVTLIGLAIAFGGVVFVIRQLVVAAGGLIQALGNKLVSALESSVDKMRKLKDATFTFQFIINNLNRETKGTIGTFEEWNAQMEQLSQTTGYSMTEVQKSVSEMLRFGDSIGLTKNQMQEMLPIIADLAEANHKDLFSSTLAVVEALAGQAVMLQNMGVNLTKHALMETKAGKAIGHHTKNLTEHEKVQLRYNALLEKTATVQGIAAASANTNTGALRRFDTAMENMSLSVGEGAEAIDTRFNASTANMLSGLQNLSAPLLKIIGFIGSLMGRLLQITGIFLKWSFAIVLVTSSVAALNLVLRNLYVSKFLLWLSQTNLLTVKLAAIFPQAAAAVRIFLTQIGVAGLSLKSLNMVILAAGKAMLSVFAKVALAMAPIVIKIGLIVGAIYIFYKALQLVESKTQVFSKVAESLKAWWNAAGLFDKLKGHVAELAKTFGEVLGWAIVRTAQGVLGLYTTFLKLKAGVIIVANEITIAWEKVTIAMGNIKDKTVGFLASLPSKMLSLVGISSAWAGSLEKTAKTTEKARVATKAYSEADKETLKGIYAQVRANEALISSLEEVNTVKSNKTKAENENEDLVAKHDAKMSLLQAFRESETMAENEAIELKKIQTELINQEEFRLLTQAYGAKEAARKVHAVKMQLEEAKTHKSEADRLKAKNAAIIGLTKNVEDAKAKIKIDTEKRTQQTLDAQRRWGYQSASNFLRAGMLLAKKGSAEMKALATAEAVINTYRGAAQALADPFVPFWMKPIAVASTIALGLAQVHKIHSADSYYKGGIVQGSRTGDNEQVNVNGGEMILTGSQQKNLYSMAQGNESGNNSGIMEAINNLASAIMQRPNTVEIDGREIARSVKNQVDSGYQLA